MDSDPYGEIEAKAEKIARATSALADAYIRQGWPENEARYVAKDFVAQIHMAYLRTREAWED